MSFEVEGTIYKKFETQQVTEKFRKREFVLEIQDGNYPQIVKFQLTQNNCEKLDPYNEGDTVKVHFSLSGREYTKDGKTSFFTNLNAWRMEGASSGETTASADSFPDEPAQSSGSQEMKADDFDDLPF